MLKSQQESNDSHFGVSCVSIPAVVHGEVRTSLFVVFESEASIEGCTILNKN